MKEKEHCANVLKKLERSRGFHPHRFGFTNAIIPLRTHVLIAFLPRERREGEQAWSPPMRNTFYFA